MENRIHPSSACILCNREWNGHGNVCESCYENAGDYLMENAYLIAVARDLYQCTRYLRLVCEDRLSIERETDNDPEVIEHYELLLADATAAIAKVEGPALCVKCGKFPQDMENNNDWCLACIADLPL